MAKPAQLDAYGSNGYLRLSFLQDGELMKSWDGRGPGGVLLHYPANVPVGEMAAEMNEALKPINELLDKWCS